jgi:hypothetical protein
LNGCFRLALETALGLATATGVGGGAVSVAGGDVEGTAEALGDSRGVAVPLGSEGGCGGARGGRSVSLGACRFAGMAEPRTREECTDGGYFLKKRRRRGGISLGKDLMSWAVAMVDWGAIGCFRSWD